MALRYVVVIPFSRQQNVRPGFSSSALRPDLTVWAYTGFEYEELVTDPVRAELARLCDVIIDGRYVEAERDVSLPFRGSRNQRLIDVPSTMASHTIVTHKLI